MQCYCASSCHCEWYHWRHGTRTNGRATDKHRRGDALFLVYRKRGRARRPSSACHKFDHYYHSNYETLEDEIRTTFLVQSPTSRLQTRQPSSFLAPCLPVETARANKHLESVPSPTMVPPTFFNRSTVWLRRYLLFSAIFLIFIALIHSLHERPNRDILTTTNFHDVITGSSKPWRTTYPEESNAAFCQRHSHLENLGLTRKIKYSRRCIHPKSDQNHDRNDITNTSGPLITHTALLDINNLCDQKHIGQIPCDPVELPVAPPDPETRGQYTHLIFGVATSYDRL